VVASFRGLTFDFERRQLLDLAGVSLHLTPKAFDLLAMLIANAPRVMRKGELHERLWPGAFVSDAALVSLIKELRRTLADHDAGAPIIRTSHGVGYAFEAPLESPASGRAQAAGAGELAGSGHWIVTPDRRIPLSEGDNMIGRMPEAAIWIDVAGVSRRHARIIVRGGLAELEDLGSKNGTIVRGARLTARIPLHDGDQIQIGPVAVNYASSRRDGTTDTIVASASSR
jgi:DNA-binding winged helix-turn-helix (wHTH) protein